MSFSLRQAQPGMQGVVESKIQAVILPDSHYASHPGFPQRQLDSPGVPSEGKGLFGICLKCLSTQKAELGDRLLVGMWL